MKLNSMPAVSRLGGGALLALLASLPLAAGAAVGAGIAPTAIDAVLGVVKAYATRVGHGPLPTEIEGELGERMRELGNEFGATTWHLEYAYNPDGFGGVWKLTKVDY